MGSWQAPHFLVTLGIVALRRRAVPMVAVTGAVVTHVAVVRSGPIGSGTNTIPARLQSGFSRRSLGWRGKNRRRQNEHQNTDHLLHFNAPHAKLLNHTLRPKCRSGS